MHSAAHQIFVGHYSIVQSVNEQNDEFQGMGVRGRGWGAGEEDVEKDML